ncbi:L-aminopeptidase/D-esterase-like protein [Tamaricihabitans halophyticus]|uniref:L-aminopeptidase/D-esterase-like protein n=1 Tax=Tamaricihabitans halophyticus TaxID=1262583 RepID=A0A4R2QE73_9PSEU|nr:P1 family peptidase [Tamaricihabitans halophyticus]TCP46754.1 L-aminopeptidase/D-esterase-like protein [Tamaricihabitans halophyticus]
MTADRMTTGRPAQPGPGNAITDVPGIRVGHYERLGDGWASGTTVVLAGDGTVGAVDSRGGAPGTRETDLLVPENLVRQVHAVCLSGGSAYGLAAADGVLRWLAERSVGLPVGQQPHEVVPIVPAAVLFDLPVGDWGNRPDADFGYAACAAAGDGPVAEGCVGAGAGARVGSLKGGLGTASVRVDEFTVGALAAVNAAGEAVDLSTGRPYAADAELAGEFGVAKWPAAPAQGLPNGGTELNTTIGVLAVDARLDKAECRRLAVAAQDGLARAVRPAHTMFDGDTVFALATGRQPLTDDERAADPRFGGPGRAARLDRLCTAAAEVFARAMVHGVLAAHGVAGLPAYREVWPAVDAL